MSVRSPPEDGVRMLRKGSRIEIEKSHFRAYGLEIHELINSCKNVNRTVVINNIFWCSTDKFAIGYDNFSPTRNCVIKGYTGPGYDIITDDPKFVDPTKGDFRLQADSPCIDAGLTTDTTTKADIVGVQRGLKGVSAVRGDGSAVDIGAYEYKPKPVAVWLPNGGPDQIHAGDNLKVAWELDVHTAGSAIMLQLYNGSAWVANLGPFWNATGADESTVKLPTTIQPRKTYSIRGISTRNATLYSGTPPMTILSTYNATPRELWLRYD